MPGAGGVNVPVNGDVRSTPSEVDPLKNSTCLTVPSESLAVAVMFMATPAPNEVSGLVVVGDVIVTVGGTSAFTVIEMGFEVFGPPALSVATAVNEYVPGPGGVNVTEYGDVMSVPREVAPLKNSTLETLPSVSLAVALIVTAAPLANVALFAIGAWCCQAGTSAPTTADPTAPAP